MRKAQDLNANRRVPTVGVSFSSFQHGSSDPDFLGNDPIFEGSEGDSRLKYMADTEVCRIPKKQLITHLVEN